MTRFSWGVQLVCLAALGSLLVYTLALVRVGRLTARVTVSWILADLIAIAAILLWGRLPVITYTSALGDRELLLVLAVLFFSYVAYLMLDSLQRISAHSAQIAHLTQQVALMQEAATGSGDRAPGAASGPRAAPPATPATTADGAAGSVAVADAVPAHGPGPVGRIVLAAWIVLCFATYLVQEYGRFPSWLQNLLIANYKE